MKKLLAILLASVMVLALSVAAMATVDISGGFTAVYDFNRADGYDYLDSCTLNFTSKVTTFTTFNLGFKYQNNTEQLDAPAGDPAGTKQSMIPWVQNANIVMRTQAGAFTVGMFEVETRNTANFGIGNNGWYVYGRQKAPFGLKWGMPEFFPGFFGNVVYFRDGNPGFYDAGETTNDGAYTIQVGYKGLKWGWDYSYVNLEVLDVGYAANLWVQVIPQLKFAALFGQDQADVSYGLLAAIITVNRFYTKLEYDTEDEAWPGNNRYAYEIGYNLSNAVTIAYRNKEADSTNHAQELRFSVSYK